MYRLYRIDAQMTTKSVPDRNTTSKVKPILSKIKANMKRDFQIRFLPRRPTLISIIGYESRTF